MLRLVPGNYVYLHQWSGRNWNGIGAPLPLNQWVKITVVYGYLGMYLYINDQLAGADFNRKIPISSRPFYFGTTTFWGPEESFTGTLDEIVAFEGSPEVKIISPASGTVFNPIEEITFFGFGLNLNWSRAGNSIGSGNIVKTTLPPGEHIITVFGQTALGQPGSDNIRVIVQGGKPRVTKLAFQSMAGQNNLNRIYDRKGTLAGQKPGKTDGFLDPTQWGGIENNGEISEVYNWPVSYVRGSAASVGNGPSKIKFEATFKDLEYSSSLTFNAQLVGKLYENGVFRQNLTFDSKSITTVGSAEKTEVFESTNGLPAKVGVWSLELEWSFLQSGISIGTQRIPKAGNYQTVYTMWEKPITNGYFFQDEESKAGGPLKVKEIPTYYLELVILSCNFASNADSSTTKEILLNQLLNNAWALGSQGYKYNGQTAAIRRITPRGLDSLLESKSGWCEEWATFFKALVESQGADIWYRGIKLTDEQIKNSSYRLYITDRNMSALGGDIQNPEPKWWSFRDHAYNSVNLLDVFDLSFNGRSASEEIYTNNIFDLVIYPTRALVNSNPFPDDIHIFLAYD